MSDFNSYANDYDAVLNRGLAISGEDKDFFANGRIRWLSRCLKDIGFSPKVVLDFGCGTGTAVPWILEKLAAEKVVGVDPSVESLNVARSQYSDNPMVRFETPSDFSPVESIDLVYCNGVFHHIPPECRLDSFRYIARCLSPMGYFALWENNPWNLGARYIMSQIPFDRDAIMLSSFEVRKLAELAGLRVVQIDYCFFFPGALKCLRRFENWMRGVPFGAQYQVLCQKK